MSTQEIEATNKIGQLDLDLVAQLTLDSFAIKQEHYKSRANLSKKEDIIDSYIAICLKILDSPGMNSKLKRLTIINFIDRLNMQKELIEIKKGNISIPDISVAGQRMGLKAQSAFTKK